MLGAVLSRCVASNAIMTDTQCRSMFMLALIERGEVNGRDADYCLLSSGQLYEKESRPAKNLTAATVPFIFGLASFHALRLLYTTLLSLRLMARSVTGEALRTNPAAARTSPGRFIRCVRLGAENGMAVEAGNIHSRFLEHYFQIFRGSDVPHHFTGNDDAVLKGVFSHVGRQSSPSTCETALNLRDPFDSTAVAASLVLDQNAVIKAGVNHFLCHEIPPLIVGAGWRLRSKTAANLLVGLCSGSLGG